MSHLVLLLLQRLDVWLVWASSLCLHPLALAIQLQGSIICLGLALGWAFAAIVRNKELIRIKDGEQSGHSFSFLYSDMNDLEHSVQAKLPRVTIIMPIKGVSEHSESNWRSQLISLYGGPTEFLFVVESKDDPAFKAVSELLLDLQDQVNAKAIVAGFSTTCSQKIHNQLAGISAMHEETKYVLFLDDDVRLHPGTIGALVTCMEQNPKIFILTGYPFDIPSGSLGSYCMFEYHMPCSMGFATGGRTFFLWGGCMMMHADDFRKDRYGMVTGLRHGGYSDDMTLAAVAGANKRLISSPPVAIFFHPLVLELSKEADFCVGVIQLLCELADEPSSVLLSLLVVVELCFTLCDVCSSTVNLSETSFRQHICQTQLSYEWPCVCMLPLCMCDDRDGFTEAFVKGGDRARKRIVTGAETLFNPVLQLVSGILGAYCRQFSIPSISCLFSCYPVH
ncbi:hypothetical protein KP509_04G090400 [Ceratopteris richardii]|uniref:ceramide glucosyltransferase n=1 Tax=Ceratopteris richardii TaxID=49495 RepID=A0A8T2UXW6_CERRI|nr:hypothetical protein KP509_04G090400 [Ceratopteris richardii]